MALKTYQEEVNLSELYEVSLRGGVSGSEQINPNIWIDSGSVDVYSSNSATQPASLLDMTLNSDDEGAEGLVALSTIPRFLAFVQNAGTSSEVILSGVQVESQGAIS